MKMCFVKINEYQETYSSKVQLVSLLCKCLSMTLVVQCILGILTHVPKYLLVLHTILHHGTSDDLPY